MAFSQTHTLYIVADLFSSPIGHSRTPTDGVPVQVVTQTLDPAQNGVNNVPQGLGAICVRYQSQTWADVVAALLPLSGENQVLVLSATDWDPVTERPPNDALLVVDFDFESTTMGDC